MKRVAAANSERPFKRPFDCSVLFDGTDEIGAATRVKSALVAKDWAEENLIQPDKGDQNVRGGIVNPSAHLTQAFHCLTFLARR